MNLQPLRIEAGWKVSYNQFYEVDPKPGNEHYFEGSSLLVLENEDRLKVIDVEWRPELDLNGEFIVRVLNYVEVFDSKKNHFHKKIHWEFPFLNFTTKSRTALVEKLEELMKTLPVYEDPRITLKRGVIDETAESYRITIEDSGLSTDLEKKIIKDGSPQIQIYLMNRPELTKESLMQLSRNGANKKVKNIAKTMLKNKKFK